jgi:hypothetical protein
MLGIRDGKWIVQQEDNMTVKVTVYGEFDGFGVNYEETFDAAPGNGFLVGITEYLKSEGFELKGKKPAAFEAPQQGNAPLPFNERVNGGQAQQAGPWQCPVHGGGNIQSGKFGLECKAYSPQPTDWDNGKPWTARDGSTRYYCKHRAA